MSDKVKILIIGGGPGGYVAAIRASQLGGDVTLVEKEQVGGTCLNIGCIPTKALLHAAEFLNGIGTAADYGIQLSLDRLDWQAVLAKKDQIVGTLVRGISTLLSRNGVHVIHGTARFTGIGHVCVISQGGEEEFLEPDRIILASGSLPVFPPIPGLKESPFTIDSAAALSMADCPEEMVVLGGGVIGVELACAFSAFGCRVTIIEALPRLLPALDHEISSLLAQELARQGITLRLSTRVTQVENTRECAVVHTTTEDGTQEQFRTAKLLVAVGRKPNTDGLSLDLAGIKTEKGRILVNENLQTSVPNVYAIGDCTGQIMLAHTASVQGECAAENALGDRVSYTPEAVPSCVYSFPEIACVGMTEEEVVQRNIPYHVGRFPLSANGRALILNGGKGLIKVILGNEMGEILGIHMIGPVVSEMVGEAALSLTLESTAEEVIHTIHAHPCVNEALREAFLAAEGHAIHIPNKKAN